MRKIIWEIPYMEGNCRNPELWPFHIFALVWYYTINSTWNSSEMISTSMVSKIHKLLLFLRNFENDQPLHPVLKLYRHGSGSHMGAIYWLCFGENWQVHFNADYFIFGNSGTRLDQHADWIRRYNKERLRLKSLNVNSTRYRE